MPSAFSHLTAPFRSGGRVSKALLCLYLLSNGIVLANSCLHDPAVGYDAAAHLRYVEALAQARLPRADESHEFFSPPLPYALPAFLVWSGLAGSWRAAKSAQLLNALLSVGLTFYLLKICDVVAPGGQRLKAAVLLLLAMLPVYYKTFAFIRGEPLVAFFAVFVAQRALLLFAKGVGGRGGVILLGVGLGLLVLSRQWGFFLFPALMLWVGVLALKDKQGRGRRCKALAAALLISFTVGGWFYLALLRNYGSVTAFSREPRPLRAYSASAVGRHLSLGSDKLFRDPVRPSFPNQLIPIFYSEVWGDYWAYFLVYGRDTRTGAFVAGYDLGQLSEQPPMPEWLETNRYAINSYLARVNVVSLLPTALYAAGFLFGVGHLRRFIRERKSEDETAALALCALVILFSLLGYLWFLARYPNPGNGDTIKATYLLQVFPFVSVLTGRLLGGVRQRSKLAYGATLALLALVFAHNLPALVTRYVP